MPVKTDTRFEDLKHSFCETIWERNEVVSRTRGLNLVQVTADRPDALIQDMNIEGFSDCRIYGAPLISYDNVTNRTSDIHGTIPTVCARLDFQADIHWHKGYSIDKFIQDRLRLSFLVINHLLPNGEKPMLGIGASQFFYDHHQKITGASVLVQLRDTEHRNKTYGNLFDQMYPEGFQRDRNPAVDQYYNAIP